MKVKPSLLPFLFITLLACTGRQELMPGEPSSPAARNPATLEVTVQEEILDAPAPTYNGQAPAECDHIRYLRFRLATGENAPLPANAVIIMIPGYLGGAGSFRYFAGELVARAGAEAPVEVWALDRRANCLEDHTGMQEAESTANPKAALDYYLQGSTINGKTFDGFYDPANTPYLSEFGLQLLMEDIHAVLEAKIPNPVDRKKTVFIAGHSMGAGLAAEFASWDFDHDPATLDDAGYNSCAGLIGLEGRVGIWSSATTKSKYERQLAELRAASQGAPFINPQAMALIEILALYAAFDPGGRSTVFRSLTVEPGTESLIEYFTTYGLEAKDGAPALGDFNLSNEAALGLFADDNFQPISIGRASLGFLVGGPVVRRSGILGGGTLFVPAAADNETLYTWANFDTIGTVFTDTTGRVVLTSAETEVTDLQQYARVLYQGPLDFYEWYYPGRLSLDMGISAAPFREACGISTLHLNEMTGLPKLELFARDLPGYDHLDVLSAAADRPLRRGHEVIGPVLDFVRAHSSGSVLIP